MKTIGTRTFIAVGVFYILIFTAPLIYAEDVLPSWNDGENNQSLADFVKRDHTRSRPCP
ncbi:MAG: hypothetical protein NPIRA06_25000 [Nitrospirales bacterium]|nr:MAG: hypothetical protein NPIRA06_25000 [Nitrospirales bacterium]